MSSDYILLDQSKDLPAGTHMPFGGSKTSWTEYEDLADFVKAWESMNAAGLGTAIHAWAATQIELKNKLTKYDKKWLLNYLIDPKNKDCGFPRNYVNDKIDTIYPTVQSYVNDSIGFMMHAEYPIVYSRNFGGTADAIRYDPVKKTLRIHDLKTGVTPAKLRQLEIYAAFFFLVNKFQGIKPGETQITLVIYQGDDQLIGEPTASNIVPIMDKIVRADKFLTEFKER